MTDGQVRHDVGVGASVPGVGKQPLHRGARKSAERVSRSGRQPYDGVLRTTRRG